MALEMILSYLDKYPKDLHNVLYILTERLGFDHRSYLYKFIIQRIVVDVLWNHTQEGKHELFSKIFLIIAEKYLQTHFHTIRMEGRRTFATLDFDLPPSPEIFDLRRTIWSKVFMLYHLPIFKREILDLLHKYCTSGYLVTVNQIIAEDANEVLAFIKSSFNPHIYSNCRVAQNYFDFLIKHDVPFDTELSKFFSSEAFEVAELLLYDWTEKMNLGLNLDEFRDFKKENIRKHFSTHSYDDFKHFIELCIEIRAEHSDGHREWQFQSGLVESFSVLAERDADLYAKVIEYYLQKDDPLKVRPDSNIYNLIEKCGAKHALDIIKRNNPPDKHKWLFSYYYCLPLKDISAECIDQICALYKEASINELPYDMDYLIKYRSLDQHIIVNVVTIILERAVQESNLIRALHMLFNPYTEANKILTELFADNIEVLEKAYFAIAKIEKHEDYNGLTFARILDIDPDFIYKHIDDIYERKEWVSRFDDTRDYSFLWKRDDWEEAVTKAINYIYEKEKERGTYLYSYANVLFLNTINNDKIQPTENQKKLFHKLMIQRKDDSEFIQFLFGIISRFDPGDRLPFIASFLTHNNKYDEFRNLFLEPNSWSWSGSAIPMYQERITFYESILPMLKTVELLQHRQYIEQHINGLHTDIEREKRNNFLEDD